MKKLLALILFLSTVALSACGTAPTPTTPASTTPTQTTPIVTTPQITTPAVTTPVGTEPLTTPMETAPIVTPICTTPAVTTPIATTPQPIVPVATTPIVTIPAEFSVEIDYTPLTEAQIAEIEQGRTIEWFDENNILTRHYGVRYYGTIAEGIVLYYPSMHQCPKDCGSCRLDYFAHVIKEDCVVYREGTFYNLPDDSTIATVRDYHLSFEAKLEDRSDYDDPYYYGVHEELIVPDGYPTLDSSGGYLGIYNGYEVYFAKTIIDDLMLFGTYIIGGVAFYVPHGMYFDVVSGEEFHTLDQAYELGLLTYEDLRAIAYYCYGESMPIEYRNR